VPDPGAGVGHPLCADGIAVVIPDPLLRAVLDEAIERGPRYLVVDLVVLVLLIATVIAFIAIAGSPPR
jgi:hypothetical protein